MASKQGGWGGHMQVNEGWHMRGWKGGHMYEDEGRATLGPPLQHRPYQERDSRSRQLVEL